MTFKQTTENGVACVIDAASLPVWDIVALAQKGILLRAERHTPENGVPVFITRAGWLELAAHYGPQLARSVIESSTPRHTVNEAQLANKLLSVLERLTTRLFSEIMQRNITTPPSEERHDLSLDSRYDVTCDLFPTTEHCLLLFRQDASHSVACAILGTDAHLAPLLTAEKPVSS